MRRCRPSAQAVGRLYVPVLCCRKVTIAAAVCSLRARADHPTESRTETVALLFSDVSN